MKIKFCPKRKSTKIIYKPTALGPASTNIPTYKCEECHYESIAFQEKRQ